MNTGLMLLIAVVPAIALMIYIYFQDNHEKEPISLLIKIFLLGIFSALPAMLLELIAEKIINLTFGGTTLIYFAVQAFFGVAIIEEGVKFLAAYFLTWRNKNFNYKFDGIVYCLFGSMGFAAIENVLYVFMSGTDLAVTTGITRGLLAIPAHGMCAIFMGYYYGNAKFLKSYGNRAGCRHNLITGFLIACSLHAFYDFCLFTSMPIFIILFYIFVVIADIFTIIRIYKAKKENQKMYEEPKYRQYWAGPSANPYQPYGGYSAPSYGGYKFDPQVVGQTASYNPQVVGQQQFAQPQQMTNNIQPQQVYMNPQGQQVQPQVIQQQAQYIQQQMQSQQMQGQQMQQQALYNAQQMTQETQYNNNLQFNEDSQNGEPQYHDFRQPVYDTADIQPLNTPGIRDRLIRCPVCGEIVSFNAFYCKACGASIHQL
ncbi:MAG: PrsW family intramembrane metalloprotease [Eubacterium sp.]|nr:PrsW family intramembrane metalloprotease [Eubacterium sp.]